jgi:hypothetical protein
MPVIYMLWIGCMLRAVLWREVFCQLFSTPGLGQGFAWFTWSMRMYARLRKSRPALETIFLLLFPLVIHSLAPAVVAPEPEAHVGPHIPVGMDAEQVMNKAQKKNAKRRAKQAAAAGLDGISENGSSTTTVTVATEASVEARLQGFDCQPMAVKAPAAGLTAEEIMGGHKFMDYEAFKAKFPHLVFSDSEDEDEDEELEEASDDYTQALGVGSSVGGGGHHAPGSGSSDGGSDDLTADAGRPGGVAAAAGLGGLAPPAVAPAGLPFQAVPAPVAYAPAVHMVPPGTAPAVAPAPYGMYAPAAAAPVGAASVYGVAPAAPHVPSPYAAHQPAAPLATPAAPYHPSTAGVAAAYVAPAPAAAAAAAAGIPVMAAGHRAGEVARVQVMSDDSDEDEDELNELLGLCGVSS